jgi:hypothetical protein
MKEWDHREEALTKPTLQSYETKWLRAEYF